MAVAKKLRGNLTTPELELAIADNFDLRKNVIVANLTNAHGKFEGLHEIDVGLLRPTDYFVEFECKLTKSDLMKDFHKEHSHRHELVREMYYVMPMNVVSTAMRVVPEHCGIIGVRRNEKLEPVIEIIRETTVNPDARKWTIEERLQLLRLGNMRVWKAKRDLVKLRRELGR